MTRVRPTPRWWAGAARTAGGLSLFAVTALWTKNADPGWGGAGRLAALWSADLMLIQVVLMAHIPMVERSFGQDTLARWHRWIGFASFHLMLAVVPEASGLVSVYLRGRRLDRLPVRAGQFFVWRFLHGRGWTRGNPFSLSGPPRGDQLRITVKQVGDGSTRVTRLAPGTRVLIEGPYGRLTAESYRGGPVTMLACGVGITPLLALLWDLPYGHGQATLIYRARHPREMAFLDEIEWLARQRGVRLVPLIGPRAHPGSWLPAEYADYTDAEAMRVLSPDIGGHDLYVCGPDRWTGAVRAAARAAGVPADRVHQERFGW